MSPTQRHADGTGHWLVAQQHAARKAERARVSAPQHWPQGWYPDPYNASRRRWWDGGQWTADTAQPGR